MIKKLQKWILAENLSEEAKNLFDESILCYKAQAWRSALLMSYIGFMTIVRDRILSSSQPSGYTEAAWLQKYRDLKNPDKWDSNAYDCIKQKSPAPIFYVSEDIQHQMEYWKNRRNDCAHSKPNLILSGHVESFYSFIVSNSGKFCVNGSRNSLLTELKDYFNIDKTPLNAPIEPGQDHEHFES